MANTALLLYDWLFNLVVLSALICCLLTLVQIIRKKNYSLVPFVIFYLFSAFVSLSSSFESNKSLIEIRIFSFYTFDILFFLYYFKEIYPLQKRQAHIIFVIIAIVFICVIIEINKIKFNYNEIYEIVYELIILFFLLPKIRTLFKDRNNQIEVSQFELWFAGAFFIYNLTTLPASFLLLFFKAIKQPSVIPVSCYLIIYLSWIIKYYVLLKSILCKRTLTL